MDMLMLAPAVLVRPTQAFTLIKKDRTRFNYLPAVLLILLAVAVRIIYIYTNHFPLNDVNPWEANLIYEFVMIIVPILSFVVANYLLLTILNGECYMREILMAAAFAMMPYIILTLPMSALSHLLSAQEKVLFDVLWVCIYAWVLILFFVSVKVMNHFTIWQAIAMCLITVCGMLLLWLVFILLYALTEQFIEFIAGLYREVRNSMLI